MVDKLTLDRIRLMHPFVRVKLEQDYNECCTLISEGFLLRFTQTLRTFDEQNILFSYGRTKLFDENGKRLGKVTNAKGGESYHNYGLAFDFCLLKDTDGNGTFETVLWDEKTISGIVIGFFKGRGWEWGGDFKSFKDYPHFQRSLGHKISVLQAKYRDKQFIPNTKYLQL
jgi:peptidoglycan LD-endopeptidase CwlK